MYVIVKIGPDPSHAACTFFCRAWIVVRGSPPWKSSSEWLAAFQRDSGANPASLNGRAQRSRSTWSQSRRRTAPPTCCSSRCRLPLSHSMRAHRVPFPAANNICSN